MTGEPTHTALKERTAPELKFSSEHVHQLSLLSTLFSLLHSATNEEQ